jgi:CHAT domain
MGLLLRAVDVAGPARWRWLLTDADTGAPLADHQVNLQGASAEVARFAEPFGYVRSYAAPDRQVEDGTKIVADAGAWAGSALLGDAVGKAIADAAAAGPVSVQVVAPPPADAVLLWPLELAHVAGKPLAARGDVTFVYDITGTGSGIASTGSGQARQGPVAVAGPHAYGAHVYGPGGAGRSGRGQDGPLRVLAVFSQPTKTTVLALRRERYALSRLIRRVAARERAAVELRVLQYGVTRKILGDIAAEGDGWDLLHLSGHGENGAFLLEKSDGSMDIVPTADLVRLLSPVRGRVRLTVVSACWSAADATARTYRLLGLTEQAEALEAEADQELAQATTEIPGLARALVSDLGCPVVGMRYPVTDEFAIAFGGALYEEILSRKAPVDTAVARAVAKAANLEAQPSDAVPALSVATPGVFGAHDPGLRIGIPRGRPLFDLADQRMAYFPDEPARFVGRAAAMAKASAALAPDSGKTGILLHGMAGAGKTACALELAYRHQDEFSALAFWQAPTKDEEWTSGLADFANRLDIQLADYDFTMASHIATEATLRAFAPRLRRLLADAGILVVLDNLETLLTPDGTWRDPRWGILLTALTTHDGESRVILTSRIAPADLATAAVGNVALEPGDSPDLSGVPSQGKSVGGAPGRGTPAAHVATLPVHALSLAESTALARELPNLRALLHADTGPLRPTASQAAGAGRPSPSQEDTASDRDRVLRVLRVVQGHPKLMELADAAASDRDRLDRQLAAAEAAADSAASSEGTPAAQELDAFFRDGETSLDPDGFVAALGEWTRSALTALSPQARRMAEFIACLEDADRRSDVIDATWPDLWRQIHAPEAGDSGDPPAPGPLLGELISAALIEAEPIQVTDGGDQPSAGTTSATGKSGQSLLMLRMHPGVAAAVANTANPGMREAADVELAAFWRAVFNWAREREGGEDGARVVRAGLAAAPYLLRQGEWRAASILLEEATVRDASPGLVQAVLPSLRRIAGATGAPIDAGVLARVLMRVDRAEAERLLRGALDAAAAAGDYRAASHIAVQLVNLLVDAGRLGEALAVAGQKPELTRQAGLGPWTQLLDQGRRLQVLGLMGDHAQVLAGVDRLRAAMAALPRRGGPDEAVDPWNVREVILNIGGSSALATGEWARCLELNAEIVASLRGRGAGAHEVTRIRFNDAGPLIGLGRLAEAGRLLAECQRVFEDHADTIRLAKVLSARASLGRPGAGADLERAALRLRYARPEPWGIEISHHNLANYLGRLGGEEAEQRAHRLAAALICRLAGMAHDLADTVRVLAGELPADAGADLSLPSTVAGVIEVAERTEGVRLAALLTALEPDPAAIESALSGILTAATTPPDEDATAASA